MSEFSVVELAAGGYLGLLTLVLVYILREVRRVEIGAREGRGNLHEALDAERERRASAALENERRFATTEMVKETAEGMMRQMVSIEKRMTDQFKRLEKKLEQQCPMLSGKK